MNVFLPLFSLQLLPTVADRRMRKLFLFTADVQKLKQKSCINYKKNLPK